MFTVVKSLTFWWPVKVVEPDPARPGKGLVHEFEAQFVIVSPDEARAWARQRESIVAEIAPDMGEEALRDVQARLLDHDRKAMLQVMRGWRNIVDEDGAAIPFSENAFDAAWAHRRIQVALVKAYDEAITLEKGRVKN